MRELPATIARAAERGWVILEVTSDKVLERRVDGPGTPAGEEGEIEGRRLNMPHCHVGELQGSDLRGHARHEGPLAGASGSLSQIESKSLLSAAYGRVKPEIYSHQQMDWGPMKLKRL
jgi:hypothetical protein